MLMMLFMTVAVVCVCVEVCVDAAPEAAVV